MVMTSMHPLFLSPLSLVWHVPTYVAAIMEIENGSISSLIWMKVFAHTHTHTHTVSHTCATYRRCLLTFLGCALLFKYINIFDLHNLSRGYTKI